MNVFAYHKSGIEPVHILGVRVDVTDSVTALNTIEEYISKVNGNGPREVFFTNVHTIHLARKDDEFRNVINNADIVLPDGSGLKLAGRLFKRPIIENLNGTDFMPKVIRNAAAHGWSVFLLGSTQEVLNDCRRQLLELYPVLKIIGAYQGHFSKDDESAIIDDINAKRPDILLVALGSPLQEMWIARNAHALRARVCFGVGGLFDFISGQKKRAPLWIRKVGLEWLYRFLQDPKTKWNRVFIEIPLFLILVLLKSIAPGQTQHPNVPHGSF